LRPPRAASLLESREEYAAARPLYQRAQAILREAFGSDHPQTAIIAHNLWDLLAGTNVSSAEAE